MRRANATAWHFHPGHPEVVVPRRIDPTGRHGPTASAVRGPCWQRLGSGWFVERTANAELPAQRIVEAAVHLTDYGGVTGWAALNWMGARWFDGTINGRGRLPVALVIGSAAMRTRDGTWVGKERLAPTTLTVVDGLRVTTAVRSVLYEMRYAANVRAAVRIADLALYSDLVSRDELSAYATPCLNGWTGVPQAREALLLTDENCWSPPESDMRMVWTLDAGLAPPLCNRPVFDLDGQLLFTPDLFDPEIGLAGEYDGGEFHPGARRADDLDRDELKRGLGIEPVTMVAADLRDTGPFLRRLEAARTRALGRAPGPRRWTLDPPPWWKPIDTVARRRALSPADRARLLRGRGR